jgi:hypothetical protein
MIFRQPCCASVLNLSVAVQLSVRTLDAQVSAHEGFAHVHVFYLHFDFVLLAVGRLAANEAATGSEER